MLRFNARLIPLAIAALVPLGAMADMPGKHPYYVHALADLRAARWMLEHRPGDAAVSSHEDVAITRIDQTIRELRRAAIDDGKNVNQPVGADVPGDRPGRLHKAEELLAQARADVAREEDDPMARGLRDRGVQHIDEAMRQTHLAIRDVEMHR